MLVPLLQPNVTGRQCDECAVGTFHLSDANPDGCLKCFCMGVSRQCASSSWSRDQVGGVVPRCAMPSCAMLYCTVLCHVVPCHVVRCHVVPCYVVLCRALPRCTPTWVPMALSPHCHRSVSPLRRWRRCTWPTWRAQGQQSRAHALPPQGNSSSQTSTRCLVMSTSGCCPHPSLETRCRSRDRGTAGCPRARLSPVLVQVTSYGGELKYTVTHHAPAGAQLLQHQPDVLLQGNGISLKYFSDASPMLGVPTTVTVPFREVRADVPLGWVWGLQGLVGHCGAVPTARLAQSGWA